MHVETRITQISPGRGLTKLHIPPPPKGGTGLGSSSPAACRSLLGFANSLDGVPAERVPILSKLAGQK